MDESTLKNIIVRLVDLFDEVVVKKQDYPKEEIVVIIRCNSIPIAKLKKLGDLYDKASIYTENGKIVIKIE